MGTRRRLATMWTSTLFVLTLGLFASSVAQAQVTIRYCVVGNSEGTTPWDWEIRDQNTNAFISGSAQANAANPTCVSPVLAPAGGTGELTNTFVNSINQAKDCLGIGTFPNAQTVESSGCGPDPSAAFSITTQGPHVLWVGPAGGPLTPVTGTTLVSGVTFNPTIFISNNLPVSRWAIAILALLLIGGGVLWLRRPLNSASAA